MSHLTALELLDVSSSDIRDRDDFLSLQRLTNLRVLDLSFTPFSDHYMRALVPLTKLTHLSLGQCPLLFDEAHLLAEFPRLQYLWIHRASPSIEALHSALTDARRRDGADHQVGVPAQLGALPSAPHAPLAQRQVQGLLRAA